MAADQLLLHVHHLQLGRIQAALVKQGRYLPLLCVRLLKLIQVLHQEYEVIEELFLLLAKRGVLQNGAHALPIGHKFVVFVEEEPVFLLKVHHHLVKLLLIVPL